MKVQQTCLGASAILAWLWIVFNDSVFRNSWSVWFFFVLLSGVILAFITIYVIRALEPPLPDLFKFKHSPLFTLQRTKLITKTLAEFREYLGLLGFKFSLQKVAIGIGEHSSTGWSKADQLGAHRIILVREDLDDREALTLAYARYIFGRELAGFSLDPFTAERMARQSMAFDLTAYFTWSFLGKRPAGTGWPYLAGTAPWLDAFWEIRTRFGEVFADTLLADMAKSFNEKPSQFGAHVFEPLEQVRATNEHVSRVIQAHLELADFEVDNERENWESILGILKTHGLPVGGSIFG